MRYVAKVLKDSLRAKFPKAAEDDILKVSFIVNNINYIIIAIISLDCYDIQQEHTDSLYTCFILTASYVMQVVGNLIYYRYMNPAIVAPDAFDIVDVALDKGLTPDQVL